MAPTPHSNEARKVTNALRELEQRQLDRCFRRWLASTAPALAPLARTPPEPPEPPPHSSGLPLSASRLGAGASSRSVSPLARLSELSAACRNASVSAAVSHVRLENNTFGLSMVSDRQIVSAIVGQAHAQKAERALVRTSPRPVRTSPRSPSPVATRADSPPALS